MNSLRRLADWVWTWTWRIAVAALAAVAVLAGRRALQGFLEQCLQWFDSSSG